VQETFIHLRNMSEPKPEIKPETKTQVAPNTVLEFKNKSINCSQCKSRLCWDEKRNKVKDDYGKLMRCPYCCCFQNGEGLYLCADCSGKSSYQGTYHKDDGTMHDDPTSVCLRPATPPGVLETGKSKE